LEPSDLTFSCEKKMRRAIHSKLTLKRRFHSLLPGLASVLRLPTKRSFEDLTRDPFKAIALTVGGVMLALLFLYLYKAGASPNWLARTFGGSRPHAVTSATAADGKVSAKGSDTDNAAQAGPRRPSTAALQTVEANPAQPPASEASAADTMLLKSPLPSGSVILQVAALAHEENASELVKSLRQKNFPAFLSNPSTNNAFYPVQVGPYADEESARAAQSELGRAGFNSFIRH
jgi:cell division septation protein DedD